MSKYLKVMDGTKSNANGFEYKLNEINVSNVWNPNADNAEEFGGFNFSTDNKILRWLLRGDTLYDVELPDDAEVIKVENNNTPNGVFRSNKIIVSNPRPITDELVIELYKKSDLPEKTYYQCLVTLLFRNHLEAVKYIIRDRINKSNVDDAIVEFENFISKCKGAFNYNELWESAKEIYDILKEIQSELYICLNVDKEPYIKTISNDKVINLTGESGSGKSYYSNKYINDENYIVIDTDIVFSGKFSHNKESVEIRELFKGKTKESFINDFDKCYLQILDYFKDTNKTIVIDSAQYRNIKDYSILKGKVIVMRTCIDTCYERCLKRYEINNPSVGEDDKIKFANRKLTIYKWYKSLNIFLKNIDKI